MTLTLRSPGREDMVLTVPENGKPAAKGPWFTLKEGSKYTLIFTFRVTNNIVSGLRYSNTVWKTGIKGISVFFFIHSLSHLHTFFQNPLSYKKNVCGEQCIVERRCQERLVHRRNRITMSCLKKRPRLVCLLEAPIPLNLRYQKSDNYILFVCLLCIIYQNSVITFLYKRIQFLIH